MNQGLYKTTGLYETSRQYEPGELGSITTGGVNMEQPVVFI